MMSQLLTVSGGPTHLDDAASLALNGHYEASVLEAQRHLEGELLASRARFRRLGSDQTSPTNDAPETRALLDALRSHGTAGTTVTATALADHLDRYAAALDGSRRIERDEALASISLVSDLLDVGEVDAAGMPSHAPRD